MNIYIQSSRMQTIITWMDDEDMKAQVFSFLVNEELLILLFAHR